MKIIVIHGLPGSGKSTLSHLISKKTNLPLLSKDEIREGLFEKYGFRSHAEKQKLSNEADKILLNQIDFYFKKNMDIIVDKYVRNWKPYESLFLKGVDVKIIYLSAPAKVLAARYHKRVLDSKGRALSARTQDIYPFVQGKSHLTPDMTIQEYESMARNVIPSNPVFSFDEISTENIESNQTQILDAIERIINKPRKSFDYVVIGAGITGLTIAERISTQLNKKVLIIDKQNQIGGACYDEVNEYGLLIGKFGPHTFHTDDKEVFEYFNKFCVWHEYYHYAKSYIDGKWVSFPITKQTFKDLYGVDLSDDEMESFVAEHKKEIEEKFFENFTKKQWGVDRSELDPSVTARIPFRKNYDTRYFTDKYQGNPVGGYTKLFKKMIDSPNISIVLGYDYKEIINSISFKKMVYTGPIDYYFSAILGPLLYRSVNFTFETYKMDSYQPQASARFPGNEVPYTRITEFKKMTGQESEYTTILKEVPCFGGIEYYPYWTKKYLALAEKYRELAKKEKDVYFAGRLGGYRYLDMDDAIRNALDVFERIKKEDD